MYRYLALVWTKGDSSADGPVVTFRRQLHAKPCWAVVWDTADALVVHAGARVPQNAAYTLPSHGGVVLGRLFNSGETAHELTTDPDLTGREGSRVVESRGRHLVERYWGSYVAFLRSVTHGHLLILRDPSGGLPCFVTSVGPVTLVFSHIQDVAALALRQFTVNWRYITAFFRDNHLQIAETALEGVQQVLPGQMLVIDGTDVGREFVWEPNQFAKCPDLKDVQSATDAVKSATQACVNAWASTSRNLLHQLSGGLDSAIALSCLASAPRRPRIVSSHQFAPGVREGDERRFARVAAEQFDCFLIETEIAPETTKLDRLLGAPLTANPALSAFSFLHDYTLSLIAEYSIDTFTSGHGGDQIFYQFAMHVVVADYLRQNGLHPRFLSIALDTARLTRKSIWSVLRASLAHGALNHPFDAYAEVIAKSTFLSVDAMMSVNDAYQMHPWIQNASGLPPGKMMHVCGVVDLQSANAPSLFNEVLNAPLLFASQPIVETCLRVPTYVLTNGGIDRSLVRRAFSRELPREIVGRQTKGDTTRYFVDVARANLPFIRELLLDGRMVQERLLDRTRLERLLKSDYLLLPSDVSPLLNCVVVEAWLRRWSSLRQQPVDHIS